MAKRTQYLPGPDIPANQVLRDRRGRVVDDAYVDSAVADAVGKARRRGRPSLSESGESPLLRVRIPPDLDEAVTRAAEAAGETRADWVRRALARAARRAG